MTKIGDVIQSGESIPDDVTALVDNEDDTWRRTPRGHWHLEYLAEVCVAEDECSRSGMAPDSDGYGPFTVTAVREPEPDDVMHYRIPGDAAATTLCGLDVWDEDTSVTERAGSSNCPKCRAAADEAATPPPRVDELCLPAEAQQAPPRVDPEQCPHGYVRGDHHWYGCMGVSPEAKPQQADASALLDLVRQYGSQRYMHGLDQGAALPDTQGHEAASEALLDRIAALVPQQPVQANDGIGNVWWLHRCGYAGSGGIDLDEDVCPACGRTGPWRPLLVGVDPAPDQPSAPDFLAAVNKLTIARDGMQRHRDELHVELVKTRGERENLRAEAERLETKVMVVQADRDDYAARLKATDANWAKVAAERDEARADFDRLASAHEAYVKAVQADAPQQPDPLVLSLPKAPKGATLVGKSGSRWTPYVGPPNGISEPWRRDTPDGYETWAYGLVLQDDGPVRVEMAPPRVPRIWPKLDDAELSSAPARVRVGSLYFRRMTAAGTYRSETSGGLWSWWSLRGQADVTEVFDDEPGGQQ